MQRAQTLQFKNGLADRRVPHLIRHPIVQAGLSSVPQRIPFQRKPVRLLRALNTNHEQIAKLRHRALADESSAGNGETGIGAFYEAQEEAARRIALRLHDESAQMLATVYLQLALIARDCPDSTVEKINAVIGQLDEVREQIRGLSHELSPPILDQLGLLPALQSLAKGVSDRSGLKIVVCGNLPELPRAVGGVLYRVVQEALSNVVRHAQAAEALVRLSIENNHVLCTVNDDGIGLKTEGDKQAVDGVAFGASVPVYGLGLTGIHQRVAALKGRYHISSGPKGGLQLQVEIPL